MSARATPPPIDLALQGGGSHGAFTWGVLDRLLEDEALAIDGVSGTSAGALNAAVMATGWAEGGRAGARAALQAFWHDVARAPGCFGPCVDASLPPWLSPWAAWTAALPLGSYNLDHHPGYAWMSQALQLWGPYQFNPLGDNPLRPLLQRHVQVPALRDGPLRLFVTATAVRTGQPRVFSGTALSHEALMASACLPQLYKAVTIDGEPYWDGGYSGNPALWPLIYETPAMDVVLVRIDPLVRMQTPTTPDAIADRVNEISFNAALASEMRAIHFVQRLLAEHRVDPAHYRSLRLHAIADDAALEPLHASSKLNTDLGLLQRLQRLGRDAADRWLRAHRRDLGRRSTLDVAAGFLAPRAGSDG